MGRAGRAIRWTCRVNVLRVLSSAAQRGLGSCCSLHYRLSAGLKDFYHKNNDKTRADGHAGSSVSPYSCTAEL